MMVMYSVTQYPYSKLDGYECFSPQIFSVSCDWSDTLHQSEKDKWLLVDFWSPIPTVTPLDDFKRIGWHRVDRGCNYGWEKPCKLKYPCLLVEMPTPEVKSKYVCIVFFCSEALKVSFFFLFKTCNTLGDVVIWTPHVNDWYKPPPVSWAGPSLSPCGSEPSSILQPPRGLRPYTAGPAALPLLFPGPNDLYMYAQRAGATFCWGNRFQIDSHVIINSTRPFLCVCIKMQTSYKLKWISVSSKAGSTLLDYSISAHSCIKCEACVPAA